MVTGKYISWGAGHSLGAGVAAMLSLKIHQRAEGVKCWAFCPPGGLLSQNLSHAAEEYCTSIIVNKDMVPRLSLKTVYRLFEGELQKRNHAFIMLIATCDLASLSWHLSLPIRCPALHVHYKQS